MIAIVCGNCGHKIDEVDDSFNVMGVSWICGECGTPWMSTLGWGEIGNLITGKGTKKEC